jgi:maleate isomerase
VREADAMTRDTGIRATTSMLGFDALMKARRLGRIGVVTPYSDDGHARTLACLAGEGYEVVADAHAGLSDNLSYASLPLAQIAAMARTVAARRPQAIVCLCTNMPAAVLAAPLEAELGLPVYDSTALGVWHALALLGIDCRAAVPAWGSLFGEALPATSPQA